MFRGELSPWRMIPTEDPHGKGWMLIQQTRHVSNRGLDRLQASFREGGGRNERLLRYTGIPVLQA